MDVKGKGVKYKDIGARLCFTDKQVDGRLQTISKRSNRGKNRAVTEG